MKSDWNEREKADVRRGEWRSSPLVDQARFSSRSFQSDFIAKRETIRSASCRDQLFEVLEIWRNVQAKENGCLSIKNGCFVQCFALKTKVEMPSTCYGFFSQAFELLYDVTTRFGDVSETNGSRDPRRVDRDEKRGIGTRQRSITS